METVVNAKVVRPYVLDLTFSDGTRREVDLEGELYGEVFEPLRDPSRFAEVSVDRVLGTVVWPNGADFSAEFLYAGSVGQAMKDPSVDEFRDDDEGYQRWTVAHPGGFVVNAERKPRPSYLVLHRATCATITGKPLRGKTGTKDYIKLCALSVRALQTWAAGFNGSLHPCSFCGP